MEAEDEDEEREDVPELTALSAAPVRQAAGDEDGPETALAVKGERAAPDQAREADRAREPERSPDRPRAGEETPAGSDGKKTVLDALGQAGLVSPVRRQNGSTLLRIPGAGDLDPAAPAGIKGDGASGTGPDGGRNGGADGDRGLERLYRETVRAIRPAAAALPVEQAGRLAGAEDPGRTAALTVDELDRAVRRDSRRYDGGMTLF